MKFFASYFSENNNSITKHMKLKSDKLHDSNLRRSGWIIPYNITNYLMRHESDGYIITVIFIKVKF